MTTPLRAWAQASRMAAVRSPQGAIDEAALPLMTGDGGMKGTEPVASTRRS